ncbi:MAG: alpha/beta hydrolase [Oscillospiraceae bacterium]|nr:alpha/beta hydrolase [Oscillospiraceae bacterium]
MNDSMRESLSYFGLYSKMLRVQKKTVPESVSFGNDKDQYFLYYEPDNVLSDKVIIWVHGGGWNAGTPKYFDFVGQCVANAGYRFVSIGYRLSPKNKYPCQIEDVCNGYKSAIRYLNEKKINTSKVIVSGPSAGAHLSSILCYSKSVQEEYDIDVSNVVGFIGVGGPYSFSVKTSLSVRILLDQLFAKGYDRTNGEPCSLMTKNNIPMLLIQSKHDGLIDFSCAERFYEKAKSLGNECELYEVVDKKNTHSWYTAGMFLETREENQGLDKFFSWIEKI